MAVILPKVLTSQPKGSFVIDWSNPLTNGLSFAQVGDEKVDRVTDIRSQFNSGTITKATGAKGTARQYSVGTDQYQNNINIDTATAVGMYALLEVTVYGDNSAIIAHTRNVGNQQGCSFFQRGGTSLSIYDGADVAHNTFITSSEVENAGIVSIGGGIQSGKMTSYLNGIERRVKTTSVGAPATGAGLIKVASSRDTVDLTGKYYLTLMWNRIPSAAEYAELHVNPWQIFKSQSRLYVSADAVGVTGTINYTNANDTMSATGSTTIKGSSSTTNANDTIVATGSTTIRGTSNTTNANDTMAASGRTTIRGTSSTTNANDTMVASGIVTNPVIGTVNYTNNNDVMTAQGTTPASTLFGGVAHFEKLNEYNKKRKQKAQESVVTLDNVDYDAPITEPVVIAPKAVKKRKVIVAEPIQITPDLSISSELRDEMIKEYLLKVQEQQEEEQAIVTIIMALV